MPSDLGALSPELLKRLISYIPQPSDLTALCLVSKQLRAIATPALYHTVVLDLSARRAFDGFCSRQSLGHGYVRELTFLPLIIERDAYGKQGRSAVQQVLLLLPRNVLTQLTLPETLHLDKVTVGIMCTRQSNLRSIRLGSLGFAPAADNRTFRLLKNLTTLRITDAIYGEHDIDHYAKILQESTRINTLELCLSADYDDEENVELVEDAFQDGLLECGILSTTLLAPFMQKKLCLVKLQLKAVDLFRCRIDSPFAQAIKFELLSRLHLYDCPRTGELLEYLAIVAEKTPLCLKGFICTSRVTVDVNFADAAATFLSCFSGLQYLMIDDACGEYEAWIDMSVLETHYATLTDLYMGFGSNKGPPHGRHLAMSLDELQDLCSRAQNLKQLALAWPSSWFSETRGDSLGIKPTLASPTTLATRGRLH